MLCQFLYQEGPKKGQKCNAVLHPKKGLQNRNLCCMHQKKELSIYKSNIKSRNRNPIECAVCMESIEDHKSNRLKCGHIIHYYCICKNSAMKANIHTCDYNYLLQWSNILFDMAKNYMV